MAKKRLKFHNKQGQDEAFDISVENVTLDNEGKTLGTKLAELEHDIEESGDGTYSKPPGGIPASDLAGDIPKDKLSQSVQDSLSKADTALQQETDPTVPAWAKASNPPAQVRSDWNQTNPNVASFIVNKPELAPVATSGDYNDLRNKPAIPEGADLSGLFANVSYNSTLKQISFLDKGNNVVGTLDASPFVRDGMVSGVSLTNGVLTITFNTDSGKTPIEITLGDLFNTDNYYTKTDADGKFVVKVTGKGLSTNDYTDADQAKLQALPTADGLTQQLNSKANASEVVKSVTINGQTQTPQSGNVSFNVQAGETVVINSDGANIVDGQSESILTAPSSRMMKEIYINLQKLFDPVSGLAGIAFLGTKPTWQTVDIPDHTITLNLTDATAEFNNESVSGSFDASEGEVTIKLTPAQGKMVLANNISIMLGNESVPFALATDNGSVLVTFILAGDVVFTASASSGIGVTVSGNNVTADVQGIPLSGENRTIILSHPNHFDWDGSIALSVNNVALVVDTDYTITDNQNGTKTITILKTFSSDDYPIVISANAVEDDFAVLDLDEVGSNVAVKRGSENLLEQSTPPHVYAGETISILPVGNNKVSATVTVGSTAATLQGNTYNGFTYTLDSNDVSSSGTSIAISASATALATFDIDLDGLVGVSAALTGGGSVPSSILEGSALSITLSKTDPSASGSVVIDSCTMGSEDITPTNDNISINHVTDDITIVAHVGVAQAMVHSWGYTPKTDGDNKQYLEDTAGDFWLYQADAGYNQAPAATNYIPENYYANGISDRHGYGLHRTIGIADGGSFTMRLKKYEPVKSSYNNQIYLRFLEASSVTQGSTSFSGGVNGQFMMKYVTANGQSTSQQPYVFKVEYNNNGSAAEVTFNYNSVPNTPTTGKHTDLWLVHDASTKLTTVYYVEVDETTASNSVLKVLGAKTLSSALAIRTVAYYPSETRLNGLDLYNYAMTQAQIEAEYGITSNNE